MGNELLRSQRKLRGWSQEDVVQELLALGIKIGERQLGLTRGLVSRWERGVARPRSPYPKLLCLLFEATAEELGLVSPSPRPAPWVRMEQSIPEDDVERRELLALLLRAAGTAPAWAMLPRGLRPPVVQLPIDDPKAPDAIAAITGGYRRLDESTPSPELLPLALGHLQYASSIVRRSAAHLQSQRAQLAAAASEAAGLAGSVAFDNGNRDVAFAHYETAIDFADQSGNDLLRAFSLSMMSYFQSEVGRRSKAVGLLEKGKSLLPKDVPPTIEARMGTYEANTYASLGDRSMALAALARVDTASERIGRDEEMFWPLVFPFDAGRLQRERGACAARLGLPEMALPALEAGLNAIDSMPTKRRALALCDLAESRIRTGEIEEACRHAAEAFAIGIQMGSDRVLQRIGTIRNALTPWKETPAVKELEDRLMETLLGGRRP